MWEMKSTFVACLRERHKHPKNAIQLTQQLNYLKMPLTLGPPKRNNFKHAIGTSQHPKFTIRNLKHFKITVANSKTFQIYHKNTLKFTIELTQQLKNTIGSPGWRKNAIGTPRHRKFTIRNLKHLKNAVRTSRTSQIYHKNIWKLHWKYRNSLSEPININFAVNTYLNWET